jgi:hypothetical protein
MGMSALSVPGPNRLRSDDVRIEDLHERADVASRACLDESFRHGAVLLVLDVGAADVVASPVRTLPDGAARPARELTARGRRPSDGLADGCRGKAEDVVQYEGTGTSGPSAGASRRKWLDGVARARAELGDDRFEKLVAAGAALSDDEAVAFLCEPP